ncbi:hypothetical protein [Furfurilactobacillus rossiae]|uniref:Lipoprotein n=1 Tax=Furfurilactobacillus rossiae DSM 15814 TaxID=1114972 RepID=A0A0R1RHM2_9LACO|nr:hypothetical protein [Furfurilactobacillus rossiae]KRL53155.1 hypothetical protein FD35_GL001397 [Furfurilactobacillus rossiae DSM 15814]QFR66275.1 hypothetical protein LR814_03735 [Furfurilactobacillus rossiae]QLE61720.1 hemagglutinin protein [Furfurilactobacillus rossiae]
MKRFVILGVTILSTLFLTACGGHNVKSSSDSSSSHVSKVSRQTKKDRQQSRDKSKFESVSESKDSSNKTAASSQSANESQSKAESSSMASAQLSSQVSGSSATASQSAASSSNISKQSPTSNGGLQQAVGQSTPGISMDENTLTSFLNKYGESPAAYKIDHGMSVQQALNSTPDNMLSSGEIQDKVAIQQGYLNPDGTPTGKQVPVQNDTNSDYGQ